MAERLLKSRELARQGGQVPFNFSDLHRQCDEYLQQVTAQAEALIADARGQGEALRNEAFALGFAEGQQAGMQDAERKIEERASAFADARTEDRLRTAMPALAAAVDALQTEREKWLKAWESAAVRLSAAMAERILKRTIEIHPEIRVQLIHDALSLAAGSPRFSLRIHPADIAELEQHGQPILEQLAALGQATVVPDARLSPGGCLIDTVHGQVDARLESQVEQIVSELLSEE